MCCSTCWLLKYWSFSETTWCTAKSTLVWQLSTSRNSLVVNQRVRTSFFCQSCTSKSTVLENSSSDTSNSLSFDWGNLAYARFTNVRFKPTYLIRKDIGLVAKKRVARENMRRL